MARGNIIKTTEPNKLYNNRSACYQGSPSSGHAMPDVIRNHPPSSSRRRRSAVSWLAFNIPMCVCIPFAPSQQESNVIIIFKYFFWKWAVTLFRWNRKWVTVASWRHRSSPFFFLFLFFKVTLFVEMRARPDSVTMLSIPPVASRRHVKVFILTYLAIVFYTFSWFSCKRFFFVCFLSFSFISAKQIDGSNHGNITTGSWALLTFFPHHSSTYTKSIVFHLSRMNKRSCFSISTKSRVFTYFKRNDKK